MSEVRLQLWLAKSGVASRRRAEAMIVAGQIEVNGKPVTKLGTKVDPVHDRVTVRGKPVEAEAPAYLLLNKPKGYVTTAADPDGRQTVFDLLGPQDVRLYSVGRLDYNTEGALLLTNDGELAHALMHPSHGVRKVYHAKMQGDVTKDQIRQLQHGVDLPPPAGWEEQNPGLTYQPERSAPATVALVSDTGKHTWLEIGIHEGKNRQIHRMAAAVGSSVRKLVRVAYGSLTIEGLETGAYRQLTETEIGALRQLAGLSKRPAATAAAAPAAPRSRAAASRREGSATREDGREPAPRGRARDEAPVRGAGPARGAFPRDEAPRSRDAGPPRGPSSRGDAPRSRAAGPARGAFARDEAPRSRTAGPARGAFARDEAPRSRTAGPARGAFARDEAPRSRTAGPARGAFARDEAPRSRAAGPPLDEAPRRRGHEAGPPRGRRPDDAPPRAARPFGDRPAAGPRDDRAPARSPGRAPARAGGRDEAPRDDRPAARQVRRRPSPSR